MCMQGDKEFNVEVSMLARLRHPCLIHLLGVCVDGDQRVAVFELLKSSLAAALQPGHGAAESRRNSHASASTSGRAGPWRQQGNDVVHAEAALSWRARLRVALDIAQGLAHLHQVLWHPGRNHPHTHLPSCWLCMHTAVQNQSSK